MQIINTQTITTTREIEYKIITEEWEEMKATATIRKKQSPALHDTIYQTEIMIDRYRRGVIHDPYREPTQAEITEEIEKLINRTKSEEYLPF